MRKLILAVTLVLAFLFSVGCNSKDMNIDYSQLNDAPISSVRVFNPAVAQEVIDRADYIIKGKFTGDRKVDYQYSGGVVSYACTISPFQIDTVYKGGMDEGSTIKIVEDYYIDEELDGGTIFHLGNYYPSDLGRDYLIFLKEYSPESRFAGQYYLVGSEYGRYPYINSKARSVNIETYSNLNLNLGSGNSNIYRSIYEEKIEEYMS